MDLNKRKNIVTTVAAIFLFAALRNGWPYGFFTLLRFIVFAISSYNAWLAYEHKKEMWIWIFGFLAILFNPFVPIYLNRELWRSIDFAVGVFMIISIFAFRAESK